MDHPILNGSQKHDARWFTGDMDIVDNISGEISLPEMLGILKDRSIEVNREWAEKLGINPATATTCIKPSGTVSQLTDTASGIHPRYSQYYTRTVRADSKDPLAQLMISKGVPWEPDVMKPDSTVVFSFPVKAPEGSVFRDDRTAIEQLGLWKTYQLHYCEHKPSITVYVKDHEWLEVAAWVYKNFDIISGVSFLPHSNHSYRQAPYQEITEEQYLKDLEKVVDIDWNELTLFENEDQTISSQELACAGGQCEI